MLEGEQSKPTKAPKNSSDVSQSASSSSAGPLRGGIRQRMAKAEAIEAVKARTVVHTTEAELNELRRAKFNLDHVTADNQILERAAKRRKLQRFAMGATTANLFD